MSEHLDSAVNDLVRECLIALNGEGMSQRRMAELVGVAQAQISRLMRGGGGTTYRVASIVSRLAGRFDEFAALTGTQAAPPEGMPTYSDPELESVLQDTTWTPAEARAARGFAEAAKHKWGADAWQDFLVTIRRIEKTEAQRRALAEVMSRGIDQAESKRHSLERAEAAREQMRSRHPKPLTAPIVDFRRPQQANKR